MSFNNEEDLWNYIETHYEKENRLLFLDLIAYYEIKYCNNYVHGFASYLFCSSGISLCICNTQSYR
jgi:hypothetical protein